MLAMMSWLISTSSPSSSSSSSGLFDKACECEGKIRESDVLSGGREVAQFAQVNGKQASILMEAFSFSSR